MRLLEDQKVPTRSGRPWNTPTVRDLLTNPRYAGWAVYQGGSPPTATATWCAGSGRR
ncbi:MAG: recombinase family protein [Actinomycetia bacterium]|nr:recombinase family protein [Mycobacterium sp.]MCH9732352.1 recombinase family protein [Actinomycetes bacterium]